MTKSLLIFLLSSLKLGKLTTTGASMAISLAVYASLSGWRFAAGFIGLTFLHEMGHYVAARQRDLPVGAPMLLAMMFYRPSPAPILVAALAAPHALKAWSHDPQTPENAAYYDAPLAAKIEYGAGYLGLVALLGVMTLQVHDMLSGARG